MFRFHLNLDFSPSLLGFLSHRLFNSPIFLCLSPFEFVVLLSSRPEEQRLTLDRLLHISGPSNLIPLILTP